MSKFYTFTGVVGNKLLHRYIDEDGKRHTEKKNFKPTLYYQCSENTQYTSIDGINLKPKQFDSINSAKEYVKSYEEIDNFRLFGENSFEYQFINEEYQGDIQYNKEHIKGFILDIEVYTPKTASYGFPEPADALSPIVSIALYDTISKCMLVWGIHPKQTWEARRSAVLDDLPFPVKYIELKSEHDLICDFVEYWATDYPDYVSAWNGEVFDFPYIVNRIERIVSMQFANKLSPFGKISKREITHEYGSDEVVDIKGVAILDYMLLYKKHTYITRESYALDFIAEEEIGKSKVKYEGNINELYEKDYQTYIDYNIFDTALIILLDEKLKLFDITFSLAYYAKVNYSETLGTVKIWEILLYNYLKNSNVISPLKRPKGEKNKKFAGAFVRHPIASLHRWVVGLDLNSLYPHLIQQYNLGAETIVDEGMYPWMEELSSHASVKNIMEMNFDTSKLIENDLCMSVNGYFYRKDKKSYLSSIMADLYAGRKKDKKEMIANKKRLEVEKDKKTIHQLRNSIAALDNLQMAKKILLNGGYGAIGNASFKYFDIRVAESITLGGQLAGKFIGKRVDDYLNKLLGTKDVPYTVYGDTDSIYVTFDALVKKLWDGKTVDEITTLLDKAVEGKILPYIDKFYQEVADYLNAENKMVMEREIIAPAAIFMKKKKYIAIVSDEEGVRYTTPKLKVIGLEAVRSTTPKFCREELKKCYRIAMSGTQEELYDEIENFREKFFELPVESIAQSSSCNNIEEYMHPNYVYKKATPKHVKGAIIHNMLIERYNLNKVYNKIKSGDKVKILELNKLNTIGYEVIGFADKLPEEFDLESSIDKETMFYKIFVKPMESVLGYIDWRAVREVSKPTLEEFF